MDDRRQERWDHDEALLKRWGGKSLFVDPIDPLAPPPDVASGQESEFFPDHDQARLAEERR